MTCALHPAAGDTPYNPERAARAFHHATKLEGDLNRIRNMLRILFIMDLGDVCSDPRDEQAILEIAYIANDALDRIVEGRKAICDELHPFAYPHRHGWVTS